MKIITLRLRTLFLVAVAVGAVWLFGCGDNGANTGGGGYLVSVSSAGTGATGGGSYAAGAVVTISAGTPPTGYTFSNWTTTSSGVAFNNAGSATTWFTMPANAVTVIANFQQNSVTPPGGGGGGDVDSVTKKWMKKNLNVTTEGSWCYNNSADSCAKYGRLYTWAAAKTACQSVGMRLPSREDWETLVKATGGSSAGKALKSTSGWYDNGNGTNAYGFSALPGGYASTGGNNFLNVGDGGYWWTDTENGNFGYYRYMRYDSDVVTEGYNGTKTVGRSVRCIED